MRVVSFSLWGNDPTYTVGAVRNAELIRYVYPGWRARFYVHRDVSPEVKAALVGLQAQVCEIELSADWTGMLWRYFAIEDTAVEVAVFRDCDSRLSLREWAAVQEWLEEDRALHVMRDHPAHRIPIMGGMWGVRCHKARWIPARMRASRWVDRWGTDQRILAEEVWPLLAADSVEHDEFHRGRPFPIPRIGDEFVGQAFDAHDMPCERYIEALRARLKKTPFLTNR